MYTGLYPNGVVQTKGPIENDKRVGTWELYEQDGVLSGYYKPLYQDKELEKQINTLVARSKLPPIITNRRNGGGPKYFQSKLGEYKSMIIQANPLLMFLGSLPAGLEFYNQERLGHEISFEGIRNPFFTADTEVQDGLRYQRGYAVAIRQKFYNPTRFGMWYLAQNIKYTSLNHFVNVSTPISPATASELKFEYGLLIGCRLMSKNDGNGFTIDAFTGYNIGYRKIKIDDGFDTNFESLNNKKFSGTFQIGLNFGYSISFDRK